MNEFRKAREDLDRDLQDTRSQPSQRAAEHPGTERLTGK
jgi:hypothetical protein